MTDPSQASDQTPCDKTENPCKLSSDTLDQLSQAGARPKEGWVEAFDTPSSADGPVSILALKFENKDDADTFAGNARRICGLGENHGAVLQDGDVVVVLGSSSNGGKVYMDKAVAALRAKATGLQPLCSR